MKETFIIPKNHIASSKFTFANHFFSKLKKLPLKKKFNLSKVRVTLPVQMAFFTENFAALVALGRLENLQSQVNLLNVSV